MTNDSFETILARVPFLPKKPARHVWIGCLFSAFLTAAGFIATVHYIRPLTPTDIVVVQALIKSAAESTNQNEEEVKESLAQFFGVHDIDHLKHRQVDEIAAYLASLI